MKLLGAVLGLALSLVAPARGQPLFEVAERSRAHHPGEVLRFTLHTRQEFESISMEGWGRSFPAFRSEQGGWSVLVGIDLNSPPGEAVLLIRGTSAGGAIYTERYSITVEAKEFPTRRLTVDPKFVNPPSDQLARIERESRRLSAIYATDTPASLWSGTFRAPVQAVANSSFGKRSILNGEARSPHSGTDFDADTGTPVKSPNGGRVVLAGDLYYTGNTVVVDHGLGLYSLFAHLSAIDVRVGDLVRTADLLGRVGATGRVTGPHLHWSVRLGGARVDPLSLIAVTEPE